MIATLLLAAAASAGGPCGREALQDRMARIAEPAGGRVGASALLIETGERASTNGDARFPMQSVYKVPIAMAILRRVDRGTLSLDARTPVLAADLAPPRVHSPMRDRFPRGGRLEPTLEDLLRATIVDSDGTASDLLLRLVSPDEVTRFLREIGISGLTVATSEAGMSRSEDVQYRNWATPDAAADLLALLEKGRVLSGESRSALLGWMRATPVGPGRLRGLLPPGTDVAHKTGSSGTVGGMDRATNDAGIVTLPDGRHLAVVVFVSDSRADQAAREGVIAGIARAAWDCWTAPGGGSPSASPGPHRAPGR
ncbi:MAG: class A beta-lactamase [Acidobacteriota bacterium]